jgi:predicted metal-dependent phosphoesterase TrpH
MAFRCLFHLHTRRSYDSLLSPAKILARAREMRVHVLVVTDHNTIQGSLDTRRLAAGNLPMVLTAAEYKSEKGDIIGLFLREEIRSGHSAEIVQQIHAQGGLVVLPHPFKGHTLDDELLAGADLIETYNGRCPDNDNDRAKQLAQQWNRPSLAGADAHCALELGAALNVFVADAPRSESEFREQLLQAPRHAETRRAWSACRPYSQLVKAVKTKNPRLFSTRQSAWHSFWRTERNTNCQQIGLRMSITTKSESLPCAGEFDSRALKIKRMLPQITPEARRYAVKELARRAGVSKEFFQTWVIETKPKHTTISLGSGQNATIQFVHGERRTFDGIARGTIPVARAGRLGGWHDPISGSDLLLPFCDSGADSPRPLYQRDADRGLICRLDLLASFLFTLSRVEETLCQNLDEHGRFPASASLALRHDFLERPILDEHGLAFQQALSSLLPAWRPQPRTLKLKLTHDIDNVGIPFLMRTSIGHGLKRRRPSAMLQDFRSLLADTLPVELAQVLTLADISSSRGLRSAFYWKGSARGPRDSGYDPLNKKVQQVIDNLRKRDFELGVHPGYETFGDRTKLASEAESLRQALHVNCPGGRQHYLRWTPETWLDWEACGLSYDSTLGFADRFGFRAGTGVPYHPWSLRENRELTLIEVPLVLMDCTPVKYMGLPRAEAIERIKALIRRMEHTGGVFTLLWHNTPLLDPDYDGWYESILDLLTGVQNFVGPSIGEQLW